MKFKNEKNRLVKLFPFKSLASIPWVTWVLLSGYFLTTESVNADNVRIINDPTTSPNQMQLDTPAFKDKDQNKDTLVLPTVPKPKLLPNAGHIVIQKVEFSGNKVITEEDLQKIVLPFLNRSLTVRDLEELRSSITDKYVDAGYINSGAVIPSQSTAGGILKLNIVEGSLTEVRLEGMGRLRENYLRDRLLIGAGTPLNLKKLQDKYQILLKDPLIEQLNGNLLPGAHPGESILTVNVKRPRPYQLYAIADDYTTPLVGGYTGRVGGWVDNLSGFGEHFDAEFMGTAGALGINTGIDVPLNAYDTHATFRYSNTNSSLIESAVSKLNIKSNTISYEAGVSHPIYRSVGINFTAGLNFAVRESTSSLLDSTAYTFTEGLPFGVGSTKDTVIRFWQQYTQQGTNNALVMRSTFNKGINALGATIQNGGLLPTGDFFNWLGQSQYLHRVMDNGAHFVLKGALQLSANPLLPMERLSTGGVYSVRGYRENYYVRDNGFNSSIEFHYPIFGGESKAKHSLFIVPFMDYGAAWNNATVSVLNPPTNNLHSTGIGFNWHYSHINTDFYWAHDLIGVKPINGGNNIQDNGIHFKVSLFAF
ncbi:MAG: ShlB/FhaC/HecB family hemolysin secretion/activation protein [Methylococcales bacterium]